MNTTQSLYLDRTKCLLGLAIHLPPNVVVPESWLAAAMAALAQASVVHPVSLEELRFGLTFLTIGRVLAEMPVVEVPPMRRFCTRPGGADIARKNLSSAPIPGDFMAVIERVARQFPAPPVST